MDGRGVGRSWTEAEPDLRLGLAQVAHDRGPVDLVERLDIVRAGSRTDGNWSAGGWVLKPISRSAAAKGVAGGWRPPGPESVPGPPRPRGPGALTRDPIGRG